jgi:hypothetical protein
MQKFTSDMEITGLQKNFKLASFCLQTQADTMLPACECCGTMARRNPVIFPALEIQETGQAGRHHVTVGNCTVLLESISIGN